MISGTDVRERWSTSVRSGCRALVGVIVIAALSSIWQLKSSAIAAEVDAADVVAPNGFAEIIERVRPAVVGVRVKIDERALSDDVQLGPPSSSGSPLDRFFRQFEISPPDDAPSQPGLTLGSGFFVSGDGYIVTNYHVVANGKSFEVTSDDGKVYQAEIVGTDPQTDLALIKIAAQTDLPYVRLAKTEPRIGDWVLPIGNPFGLGGTVTAGIVSARGRDIGEGAYNDFIQIDAPVNKGNSGGPTFNVKGEVIGVNTAIFSPSGGSIGVAFDIPAETVRLVVDQLKTKGHVTRSWIGVRVQTITPALAEALEWKKAVGALVAQLEPDGPAAKQGIEVGDIITSVNDRGVKDPRDLARTVGSMVPGSSIKLGVFRNGQERSLTVKLAELPRSTQAKAEKPADPSERSALGLTLMPSRYVAGAGENGVVIADIDPEGVAADSGLQVGDIILGVSGRPVNMPGELNKIVSEAVAHSKRAVLVQIKRGDATSFVAISLG
ncbi:MAG TPA: Do family serine endopeptidase [Bradyrhizobium sp.]|nr:Do family serine endopeptidase [Bradyrhizobium sp.]